MQLFFELRGHFENVCSCQIGRRQTLADLVVVSAYLGMQEVDLTLFIQAIHLRFEMKRIRSIAIAIARRCILCKASRQSQRAHLYDRICKVFKAKTPEIASSDLQCMSLPGM